MYICNGTSDNNDRDIERGGQLVTSMGWVGVVSGSGFCRLGLGDVQWLRVSTAACVLSMLHVEQNVSENYLRSTHSCL